MSSKEGNKKEFSSKESSFINTQQDFLKPNQGRPRSASLIQTKHANKDDYLQKARQRQEQFLKEAKLACSSEIKRKMLNSRQGTIASMIPSEKHILQLHQTNVVKYQQSNAKPVVKKPIRLQTETSKITYNDNCKTVSGQEISGIQGIYDENVSPTQRRMHQISPIKREKNDSNEFEIFQKQTFFEKLRLKFGTSQILSMRYSPDDQLLAFSQQCGKITIFNDFKGIAQQTIREDNACNCVRWNPVEYQDCLLEGYANGAVKYRQIKRNFTNKILAEFDGNDKNQANNSISSRDEARSVNCLEFLPSSQSFLSGRSDSLIKQYDITTGKELRSLNYHKNRVFALRHINEQCFLSAGWDHTVFLFDLRANKVQKYIYGPMVFGDALDFKNYQVLCGSWREHKQLEIFDLRNDSSEEVKWEIISKGDTPSYVYSCQFSKVNDKHLVAGSTGKYELRIFDREENNACIDAIDRTLTKGVFSLDFRNNSNSLSFGTSDGQYGLLEII